MLFIRATFCVKICLRLYDIVFCLLVVLVKLSALAKWLAIKTSPRKPIRGKIISTKPRPKSARLFRFSVTVSLLHCALSLAAQCIVIGPVCLCVCLWVCYHNSKLRASIFTKLGLLVKVVTISSWLNFSRPAPREGVCGGAKFFDSALLQPARCLRLSERSVFFHFIVY